MKLLIVDDEELTREGLISFIDWEALGIDEVYQAEDGIDGLRVAKVQKPNIILCDVRMPRMNGIQMVERMEDFLPDAVVIFMSGFSDKEYLKAAIKLKAVNYVEKPLDSQEIWDTVLEAKIRFQKKLRTHQNETLYSMETASRLALLLTRPYADVASQISSLAEELSLHPTTGSSFTTFIVNLNLSDPDSPDVKGIRKNLISFLANYDLQLFYVSKHTQFQVFHIFSSSKPDVSVLIKIENYLAEQFASLGSFSISRGDSVAEISKVYLSYTTAVAFMQNSFFFDSGEIMAPDDKVTEKDLFVAKVPSNPTVEFSNALLSKDFQEGYQFLKKLFSFYYMNRNAFSNQAKDLYYKLFMVLQESRQALKLSNSADNINGSETLMERLNHCFTFHDLHMMLCSAVKHFYTSLELHKPENSTIFAIKEYINCHFSNDSLSVKDIGEHVFLSASYVCTYFKNETGQTLNQYLTECRMEKAKLLLGDAQYQIADISSKVGYSNGNYFSKSFKKYVGLSPSEYREKML